jgi:RimJ/RimL family protein N-acetyltransferase
MNEAMRLETPRLIIRPWDEGDRAAFAAMNADPEVRRYYHPALLTRAESDAVIGACLTHLAAYGFAFLALEARADGRFIGVAGLSWTEVAPAGAQIEIGWIIARAQQRQGYGREAGAAWLAHAWGIGLNEVIGYTSAINAPSRALMAALGMTTDAADDFLDPTVPEGDPLSPHVLYRIRNPARAHHA